MTEAKTVLSNIQYGKFSKWNMQVTPKQTRAFWSLPMCGMGKAFVSDFLKTARGLNHKKFFKTNLLGKALRKKIFLSQTMT